MKSRRENLIRLHHSPHVSRSLIRKMLQDDPHLTSPFTMSSKLFSYFLNIRESKAVAIQNDINGQYIMKKLDTDLQNYHCITIFDKAYPSTLRTIPDPPLVLYGAGNISLLERLLSISVVGTRKPSSYAYPAMKKILLPLIDYGFMVVSGMAQGVDQYAHQLSVSSGGSTIAVLGSGFHHIYPTNNIALYQRLASEHLVLSEYPPDRSPKKFHFPERNRIISGLTRATFVIEARLKSGSLITVDQALEQGRDVYAMPGQPGNPTSEGCHKMINDGAKLVHNHQDILEDWVEKFE